MEGSQLAATLRSHLGFYTLIIPSGEDADFVGETPDAQKLWKQFFCWLALKGVEIWSKNLSDSF